MPCFLHTIPDRSLSFQVVFTGCETDFEGYPDENVHGGAMGKDANTSARRRYTLPEAKPMEDHLAQPWDCLSHHPAWLSRRVSSSPWYAK